ncbi:MAG: GGDEF domain-containing protein [Erysipelotrichaceae bacterium]|nr:GGDEF domain-containing protein [Erysipelotrichaceae bacterium]
MDLRSIYIANGTGIFILMMLYYISRSRAVRHNIEDRMFFFMIFGVIVGCFMEAFSYTIDGKLFPGARIINYIANTYLYTVNMLLPLVVLIYVDIGLYGDVNKARKKYRKEIILAFIMFAVNIVNFFVPVSYYINEFNVYERRPFSYFYYVVILYFCIIAMSVTRRFEKENGARTFLNIKMFLIPVLVGAGLQFMFYGLSLAWLSAAIGMVCLYMMQQNEAAYIDSLVDIYNRQYFNHILAGWISSGRSIVGVMIDVDNFKSINDNYGHSEGDEALKALANILKKARKDNERVFRFAGDEFIVMKITDDLHGLDRFMNDVEKGLEKYNKENELPYTLAISYGSSHFEPDKSNVDTFMKQMDDNMYKMKTRHHDKR